LNNKNNKVIFYQIYQQKNNYMKNKILLSIVTILLVFISSNLFSQIRYTAPQFTLGIKVGASFSTNDAYGRILDIPSSYGMRAGRGFDLYGKYGLGEKRRHRITGSLGYYKYINSDEDISFISQIFTGVEAGKIHTNFTVLTGAIGYEYLFGAPCCNKQHLGLAITFNSIGASTDSLDYFKDLESAFRVGLQVNMGYEFVIGSKHDMGIELGFKYNWSNLFNQSNKVTVAGAKWDLNDGKDLGGSGFTRWIGFAQLTLGFNYYFGVKQVK
jgi:hypothetical protein